MPHRLRSITPPRKPAPLSQAAMHTIYSAPGAYRRDVAAQRNLPNAYSLACLESEIIGIVGPNWEVGAIAQSPRVRTDRQGIEACVDQ